MTATVSAQETRTIGLTVDEVTEPSLAVSADGATLYFAVLGDLVALPANGGLARQLTSGPAFDSWPSPSADGRSLYYLSDQGRGRTEIHRLHLQSGRVERLTDLGLGFGDLAVDEIRGRFAAVAMGLGRRLVVRALPNGSETLIAQALPRFSRPTFLADGRWAGLDRGHSRLGTLKASSATSTQTLYEPERGRKLEWGAVDATGSYAAVMESGPWENDEPEFEEILVVALETQEALLRKRIGPSRGESRRAFRPAFAKGRVFLPIDGGIAAFDLANRTLRKLTWSARMAVPVPIRNDRGLRDPRTGAHPVTLRSDGDARPSPDGSTIVFAAAGDLFVQRYGRTATNLTTGPEVDSAPVFSADGKRVWFARDGVLHTMPAAGGTPTDLKILVGAEFGDYFCLSEDAKRITTFGLYRAPVVQEIHLDDGNLTNRVRPGTLWVTYPSYGTTGEIVFTGSRARGKSQVYSLSPGSRQPRALSELSIGPRRAAASRDGKFIAFLRDGRAWYAPRTENPFSEPDCKPVGPIGATGLTFAHDGSLWITAGDIAVSFDCASEKRDRTWRLTANATPEPAPPPLLITNVHYVDVVAGALVRDAAIAIRDRHIVGIYRKGRAPTLPGSTTLDGRGRYVIPGLFDMHVHHLGVGTAAILAYGVTTVRQLGVTWPVGHRYPELVRLGRKPGPDFLSAAEIFEGPRPSWGNAFHIIENAAEAEALFDQRVGQGMDILKIYPSLRRPARKKLLARAIAAGVPSTIHVGSLRQVVMAIGDGVGCLEHFPEGSPELHGDVLALMAAAKVAWCPTLSVRGAGDYKKRFQAEQFLEPMLQSAVPDAHLRAWKARAKVEDMSKANLAAFVAERARILARAAAQGVTLISGSDCSSSNALVGPSIHWEMEFLVRGGLQPIDALRSATLAPARLYGLRHRGVIRAEALADLVVLRKNPLDDITHTRSIDLVVRAGQAHTPEQLLERRR